MVSEDKINRLHWFYRCYLKNNDKSELCHDGEEVLVAEFKHWSLISHPLEVAFPAVYRLCRYTLGETSSYFSMRYTLRKSGPE